MHMHNEVFKMIIYKHHFKDVFRLASFLSGKPQISCTYTDTNYPRHSRFLLSIECIINLS